MIENKKRKRLTFNLLHTQPLELEPWSSWESSRDILSWTWGQAGLSTDYISSCAEISETDNNSRIR